MRAILIGATLLISIGCERYTQGDLRDMEAADDVARCAGQYLGRPNAEPEHVIWMMCLQASSNIAKRDAVGVARRVLKDERRNVFDPGGARDLSEEMISRIRSGR